MTLREAVQDATATAWTGPLLEVDLAAVAANYRAMRGRYRGQVLAAVVKNDAYGLGLAPIVRTLAGESCTHFWVRDLAEAVRVKDIAPEAVVFSLHGLQGETPDLFAAQGVTPVLVSAEEIAVCTASARRRGRKVKVAIQLDTGLGRLGLDEADVERLASDWSLLDGLEIAAWISHLAAFDMPDALSNQMQKERLTGWAARLPPAPISLASSSGVYMGSDWHFNIARVGSALYGVQTSSGWQEGLRTCYRLTAPILRVSEVPAGTAIGYRGQTRLERPSVIATTMIGYGNGLPQGFPRHGTARIGAYSVPLVGGVAMNLSMVDVTDIPRHEVKAGASLSFLDEEQTVDKLALELGCSANVILTQIGAGTARRYRE